MTPAPIDLSAPAVECAGVAFSYRGGDSVLNGLELRIHRGEVYCLLGVNGAGKTTLIRLITGETTPRAGTVRVCGQVAGSRGASQRLGIIPQSVGLFAQLTVRDHVLSLAPLKGLDRASARRELERLTTECELSDILARRAGSLSGGQQRRVLFALALLGAPDVLVLDEPTVGLDVDARERVWAAIERQASSGKSVLLTTHYLDEAERLATRIGFLSQGRLVREGSLAELAAAPRQLAGRGRSRPPPVRLDDIFRQFTSEASLGREPVG
jgi:ABC-type multidrug transport system ATPase subunit